MASRTDMQALEILIPAETVCARPMVLDRASDAASFHIKAEAGSRATIVVRNMDRDSSFQIQLAEGAVLQYIVEQTRPAEAVMQHAFELASAASLCVTAVVTQSTGIRLDYDIALKGAGAQCRLQSVALLAASERLMQHVDCRHLSSGARSTQSFKHLASGEAHADLVGRILVPPMSQKTEAYQQSRNILLSDKAFVHVEPQLEIYADDVQCSHGATVGQLDKDALFYMEQRGIGLQEATAMLLEAEIRREMDSLPYVVRRSLQAKVSRKLKQIVS